MWTVIIILLAVVYLVYKSIQDKKPENVVRESERIAEFDHNKIKIKILEELNGDLEIQKEDPGNEWVQGKIKYNKNILEMDNLYSNLKSKFKDDPKTLVELAKDWANYWEALSDLDFSVELFMVDMQGSTDERDKRHDDRTRKPLAIKQSVETKFNTLSI